MTEERDWTVKNGLTNNSAAFLAAVKLVAGLLANHRIGDDVRSTARLIVAQLAHTQGFAPRRTDKAAKK